MTALWLLLAAQEGYGIRVEKVDTGGETTRIQAEVFEFPERTVLNVGIYDAYETLDWPSATFKSTGTEISIVGDLVVVEGGRFVWDARFSQAGAYLLHVDFMPRSQTDASVQRIMGREFVPYEFTLPLVVGRGRDIFRRAEKEIAELQRMERSILDALDKVDAVKGDREVLRQDDRLLTAVIEARRRIEPTATTASLRVTFDNWVKLSQAVETYVSAPPSESAAGFVSPQFHPTGEEITPARTRAIVGEIRTFMIQELAVAAVAHAGRQIDLVERMHAEGTSIDRARPLLTASTRELEETIQFCDRMLAGDMAEPFSDFITADEKRTLYTVMPAIEALVAAAHEDLSGAMAAGSFERMIEDAKASFAEIETKARTRKVPKP